MAVLGLRWGVWASLWLWCVGSRAWARQLRSDDWVAPRHVGSQFSIQGSAALEGGFLATGPPGKSLDYLILAAHPKKRCSPPSFLLSFFFFLLRANTHVTKFTAMLILNAWWILTYVPIHMNITQVKVENAFSIQLASLCLAGGNHSLTSVIISIACSRTYGMCSSVWLLLLNISVFVIHGSCWVHDRTKLEAARPCLSKADLLTPGCGEGKCSVIHGHQARSPGGECSKGSNSSMTFRGRCLKIG